MAGSGLWWLLPLTGLVLMGVMFFVCFRGFARAGRRQRTSGELSHLQHEVVAECDRHFRAHLDFAFG